MHSSCRQPVSAGESRELAECVPCGLQVHTRCLIVMCRPSASRLLPCVQAGGSRALLLLAASQGLVRTLRS